MIINSWQELLDSNTSQKPVAIGGFPRGGTTFAYRCLSGFVKQSWHLEEYFHQFYEFTVNEHEQIVIDKPAIDRKITRGQRINKNKTADWYSEIKHRYHMLRDQHSWHSAFIKVLPFHAKDLNTANPAYYRDLIHSHWWLMILRRDYINMTLSNLYSNHFNRFHYYGDQPLPRQPFIGSISDLNPIYKGQWLWLKKMWEESNGCGRFVMAEDITHLKEGPSRFIVKSPRVDRDKPQLFKEVFLNYDELVEAIQKSCQEVERETDGFFTFTDTQVKVNT